MRGDLLPIGVRTDTLRGMLRAFGVSHQGSVRPTNEDCFAVDQPHGLCVVADGMGGHNGGEVAARVAVAAVVQFFVERQPEAAGWPFGVDRSLSDAGNRLRTAIQLANLQVLETAIGSKELSGMGTTVVAAAVTGGRLSVGHVGDSRLYVGRGDHLRQVTHDDTWVASILASNPAADRTTLDRHPMRHALTNVVGTRSRTEVHIVEEMLVDGDLILLSTDGVHGVLNEDRIGRVLAEYEDVHDAAAALVADALACGSRDNCTALVARYSAE